MDNEKKFISRFFIFAGAIVFSIGISQDSLFGLFVELLGLFFGIWGVFLE